MLILLLGAIYLDLRFNGYLSSEPDNFNFVRRDSFYLPPVVVNVPPGKPIIIEKPVPVNVDTASIIKAYFKEVVYNDSIVNDTVKIVLKEIVSENAIRSRDLRWQLMMPISTSTIVEPRSLFYVGGVLDVDNNVSLAPFLAYKNKRDQLLTGSYNPFDRSVGVGVAVPVTLPSFLVRKSQRQKP